MTKDILRIKILRAICPLWTKHVVAMWEFEAFERPYWICKFCPLSDVGVAYRKTVEKMKKKKQGRK